MARLGHTIDVDLEKTLLQASNDEWSDLRGRIKRDGDVLVVDYLQVTQPLEKREREG